MFDFVRIFSMQSRGLSLCLGMMCHSLSRSGHAAVNKLAENLYANWVAVLESGVSYCTSREYNTRARHEERGLMLTYFPLCFSQEIWFSMLWHGDFFLPIRRKETCIHVECSRLT